MKWFVYHSDDYPGNGGIGLEEFDTQAAAANFIQERLAQDDSRTLDYYTVIKGDECHLSAVETVTKVKIGKTKNG